MFATRRPRTREARRPLPAAALRTAAAALAAGALVAVPLGAAPGQAGRGAGADASMLAGPDLSLDQILDRMSERTELFASIATRFVCTETRIENRFRPEKGWTNDEDKSLWRLAYSRDESGRLVERRGGVRGVDNDGKPGPVQGAPPMLAWTQLFDEVQARRFHFELVGSEVLFYRPARVIRFSSAARFEQGYRIAEWSGRVWVDVENFNLLRVEAEPNGQRERLLAELRRHQASFKVLGIPLADKPKGSRLQIDFGYESYGVSFPTQVRLRHFTLEGPDQEVPTREVHQILRDYEFFGLGGDTSGTGSATS